MVGQLFWSTRCSKISLDFVVNRVLVISRCPRMPMMPQVLLPPDEAVPSSGQFQKPLFICCKSHFATCLRTYCRAHFWDLPPTCYLKSALKFWNQRAASWELAIHFTIENAYPFMGLPRIRVGKPQKGSRREKESQKVPDVLLIGKPERRLWNVFAWDFISTFLWVTSILRDCDLRHPGMTEKSPTKR